MPSIVRDSKIHLRQSGPWGLAINGVKLYVSTIPETLSVLTLFVRQQEGHLVYKKALLQ